MDKAEKFAETHCTTRWRCTANQQQIEPK